MTRDTAPRKLGRYTLLTEIESGGMAHVHLAHREGADQLCVVKLLKADALMKPSASRRFQREAHLAALLDHPNLARVHDAGVEDGQFVLAAEFIPGRSVAQIRTELYHRQAPFPYKYVLHMAAEALEGLGFLHLAKDPDGQPFELVHRDVSPRNLMVSYQGAVKVIDLGLAQANLGDFHTARGTLLGTLPYVSPEQARGHALDARSDLYSVSVILFELLTGLTLVKRGSPAHMLEQILHAPVPDRAAFPRDLPDGLKEIVRTGLAKDPAHRFPSARTFREALLSASGPFGSTSPHSLGAFMRELFPDHVREVNTLMDAYHPAGGDANTQLADRTNLSTLSEVLAEPLVVPVVEHDGEVPTQPERPGLDDDDELLGDTGDLAGSITSPAVDTRPDSYAISSSPSVEGVLTATPLQDPMQSVESVDGLGTEGDFEDPASRALPEAPADTVLQPALRSVEAGRATVETPVAPSESSGTRWLWLGAAALVVVGWLAGWMLTQALL